MNMPGPSWKVARVQPKGTQNNRFSPSFHPLPPVSFFPPSTPLTNSFHLCPSVSPPFTSFSHPSPAYSFASFRQQDSVGHSGPLGPWLLPFSSPRPSRSFRPTRSTACFLSLSPASVQLGLSRSFRPTQSLAASVLAFTSLFYASPPLPRLSRSFRPTRSLATSSPFLASALPLFCSWFHLSLNPVGHSGPLGSWQPLSLFSHSPCVLCHHSPTSSLPLGLSGSFRPTRSLATSSLFLASALLPLSP